MSVRKFYGFYLECPFKLIDSNPHENYDTFMKIIQQAKDTHLPRKTVKFKKKKHKKSK